MTIVSVNVGRPSVLRWRGREIRTAISKEPALGRVAVRRENLDGDRQADLLVHGGESKAVYAYPTEHYPFWRTELERHELPYGAFGENLSVRGVLEPEVSIGDRFRAGSALLEVTGPRVPCVKLAARFGREDMIRRFLTSRRSGFYLRVIEEGELGAGDPFQRVHAESASVTVEEFSALFAAGAAGAADRALAQRALAVRALPESWREWLGARLG